jgi:hypothetical protein
MMRLLKIGADEATRLGQHWMGPEHTLLGILRGEPDDLARQALERAGVDAGMVEGWISRKSTGNDEDPEGVSPNPYWHTVYGRAQGISIGLLAERHPPGTGPTFAFNYKDDDVAWVRAEEGIDLQLIVDEALERSAEPPSP